MLTAKRAAIYLTDDGEFDNAPMLEMTKYTGEGEDTGGSIIRPLAATASSGGGTGMTSFEKESREPSGYSDPKNQMTHAEKEMREARNQSPESSSASQQRASNEVRGEVGDPNSPEERLKTIEQGERANREQNRQLENRVKELEPKPFYESDPEGGGGTIHIPPQVGGIIGAGVGGLAGNVGGAIAGAGIGAYISDIPIHVSPPAPEEPYQWSTEQGVD
jgi:hypothetical protein